MWRGSHPLWESSTKILNITKIHTYCEVLSPLYQKQFWTPSSNECKQIEINSNNDATKHKPVSTNDATSPAFQRLQFSSLRDSKGSWWIREESSPGRVCPNLMLSNWCDQTILVVNWKPYYVSVGIKAIVAFSANWRTFWRGWRTFLNRGKTNPITTHIF